ncbi:signal peptide peptidase SppA [Pelosinus propionicus]|uniref:Protease-4 n=1 Tax=Pelosinus propionicus DSM 13327 TaxID=1123291 RepID=A0A1I4KDX9_9FIRM|nr:signal peptide peptidase SppA [Pelosinus propionicus]SFL76821.1 protease-4 [Pelosinus propionicus DSM 13327]
MYKKSVIIVIGVVIALSLIGLAFQGFGAKNKGKVSQADKIAIIYVDGVIIGGRGQSSVLMEQGGTDQIIKQIHQARDDGSVKAVVLRINSPGGSAAASQEVGEELKKLRAQGKVVVTSMGDVAASGGYWLAACTDKIYANPTTMTGSIGVYMPYANWEELYKKVGIYQEKIKSGPHKDILSPERQMTDEEREIIQVMVDDIYNQFVDVVAQGRKMDKEQVKKLADGRIYTGNQAKQLGLVDELGNMYDAIDGASQLAGIEGKPTIKEFGKTSPWNMLFGPSEKISTLLEQFLLQKASNQMNLGVPLEATPEKWQVK